MKLHVHDWRPYYARHSREVIGFICDACGAVFQASDDARAFKELVELYYLIKYEDGKKEP